MKRIFVLFILISFFACQKESQTTSSIQHIISPESIIVFKFDDFKSWQEAITKQSLLSQQKDNPLLTFWSLDDFQSVIDIPVNAVLSVSTLGENKIVKTISFDESESNKLKKESTKAYKYDNISVTSIDVKDTQIYHVSLGGKTVLCTSKIILENIIRNYKNDIKNPKEVTKLLNILSDQSPSLIVNNSSFPKILFQFLDKNILEHQLDLSNYSGFDINLDEDKILLSGIIFNPKEEDKVWTRFKNVNTQKSTTIDVIPGNFVSSTSILFSNYSNLKTSDDNISKPEIDSLFLNIREISNVKLVNGRSTILASNDIEQTFTHLKKSSKPQKTLGDNVIYKLNQSITIGNEFNSIIETLKAEYYSVYMDYILFSDTLETIENLIIQINNKNVVANLASYNNHINSLNNECHIQWLTNLNNQNDFYDEYANDTYKAAFKNIKWDKHELLMSQLIVEDDFGYLNVLNKKTVENQKNISVNQLARLKSTNNIINNPTFFENWRTGQQDVVYQDSQNVLHLSDTKGNLIWSKQLNEPVIGDISSIDIYQNRRIQMAFVTKNKIHIIDKNGNDVKPFPLKLRKDITQGLSIFDYDNNGKYRFTVVQDNDVAMYDKEGKKVRGFKFKKAKNALVNPAKHIRMGNKDYILVQESNGLLHILNRRGETRIDLDENLKVNDQNWYEHKNNFTSININGDILKIDQKGNLSKVEKGLLNPKFTANENNLAILSENKLYFNSNEAELPYGLYSDPIINNKYAGLADQQAQKIYVFNEEAEIIEGFPVYGENLEDMYSTESEIVLLCRDGDNALIVYSAKFR